MAFDSKPRIGIQVSSFRNGPSEFIERVKLAGSLGFEGIELIHQGPRPSPDPSEIDAEYAREILDECGLKPVVAHFSSAALIEQHLDEITGYHTRLGTTALVVAIIGGGTNETAQRLTD